MYVLIRSIIDVFDKNNLSLSFGQFSARSSLFVADCSLPRHNRVSLIATMSNQNATPPRNRPTPSRGHVTEWIPKTPASKAAARKRRYGVNTMPRLTSKTQSPMLRRQASLGKSGHRATSSPSTGDRFIPNRAKMNVDLCSASMVSAEKRRMESITMAAARQRRKLDDENSDDSSSPTRTPHNEPESMLQAEFHRRMKAALFDIPLDRLEQVRSTPVTPSKNTSKNNRESTNRTVESIVAPNLSSNHLSDTSDLSYLAYASLEELEADDDSKIGSRATRSVSETSLMSFSSNRGDENSRSNITDPYEHDQLHVLQRSAAKSSYGNILSMSGDDVTGSGLQSVVSKIGRRIPTAPTRILDAPDLVDDYYLNLISWSKDNILAVALGQCVYLWNADTGDSKYF